VSYFGEEEKHRRTAELRADFDLGDYALVWVDRKVPAGEVCWCTFLVALLLLQNRVAIELVVTNVVFV